MKLVNRETFLALPPGTIYATCSPWVFDAIAIKGDTLPSNDWTCLELVDIEAESSEQWADALYAMRDRGETRPMAESYGRDGCFVDNLFIVFEKPDLERLRDYVDKAIEIA